MPTAIDIAAVSDYLISYSVNTDRALRTHDRDAVIALWHDLLDYSATLAYLEPPPQQIAPIVQGFIAQIEPAHHDWLARHPA